MENSVAHYFAVCILSTLAGIVITVFTDNFKPKKRTTDRGTDRAYVEADLNNLEHNVREIQKIMPKRLSADGGGKGAGIWTRHL